MRQTARRERRKSERRSHRGSRPQRPFGSPDGSNTNLQDLIDNFIEMEALGSRDSPGSSAFGHSTRLLVGKMGVGKTVYLRRFQAAASDDDALYADDVRRDIPSTADVVRVCQLLLSHEVDEVWVRIWRRATCRAAISHLLRSPDLRERPEVRQLEAQVADYAKLVPEFRTRRSVYSQVQNIIDRHASRAQLRAYLFHDGWADVETLLSDALHHAPPVCFYLDSVDDQFSRAPMFWLKCQRGLFAHAMGLLEDSDLRRVHVIACLRDVVLSEVLRGTHAGRYRNAPHIRVLDWDYGSIRHFLHEKIRRLDDVYLMAPRANDPIRAWFGRTDVMNERRGVREQLEHYILRHTRLIPRDVVTVGNLLCDVIASAKEAGLAAVPDREIRRVVGAAAKGFAEQQLTVCADQIAADMIPEHGATLGYDSFYTGSSQYADGVSGYGDALVEALIASIAAGRRDRLGGAALATLEAKFAERFPKYDHVLDVLWQNGLLGYRSDECREPEEVHFFAAATVDDFKLPRKQRGYALHPCVTHKVPLATEGPPVRGFCVDSDNG